MEFGEAIEDLSHNIDSINSAKADIQNVTDFLADNKDAFDSIKQNLGINLELTGEAGNYRFTFDGKEVDLDGAKTDLENGNILDSFKKLGADDTILNKPEIQKFAQDYKAAWSEQQYVKDNESLNNSIDKADILTKKYGEPTSGDDLQNIRDKNPEMAKELDDKKEDLESQAKSGKPVEVGKWLKRTVVGIGVGLTLAGLYSLIKEHQNAMNGCWLIKTSDNSKCKVGMLTCDQAARTTGTICDPGIPGCTDPCTQTKNIPCFSATTCLKCNGKTCSTQLTQCSGDSPCSDTCSCSVVGCPPGQVLKCVDVDFWGAADDFFKGLINVPGNILSNIISILIKILIIIGIVFGLFVLFKVGMKIYAHWKEQRKS